MNEDRDIDGVPEFCTACGRRATTVSASTGARYCDACAAWIFSGFEKPADPTPEELEEERETEYR